MSWLGRVKFRLTGLVVEHFLTYDTAAFARALSELGISGGDVLMVHSSLHAHSGYRDRPIDMIKALKDAVGPHGLLVMPSMTYSDSSKAFLLRGTEMDARRSPSRMGLLTEVFRRGKDVRRSLSPTHPLVAWGDRAGMFLAGHDQTDRPFGPASPFQRLLDLDGKILCIDATPETITFTHFLEDRVMDKLLFPLYEPDLYIGKVIDPDGRLRVVPTRVLSDESRQRRREEILWQRARSQGIMRRKRIGNTRLMLLRCRELTTLVETMYANGESLFAFGMTDRPVAPDSRHASPSPILPMKHNNNPLVEIQSSLRCPRCTAELVAAGEGLRCSDCGSSVTRTRRHRRHALWSNELLLQSGAAGGNDQADRGRGARALAGDRSALHGPCQGQSRLAGRSHHRFPICVEALPRASRECQGSGSRLRSRQSHQEHRPARRAGRRSRSDLGTPAVCQAAFCTLQR